MSTTKLFKKHFGDTAFVDMKHPNMEGFFNDLNAECLEEDKYKKCNIHSVTKRTFRCLVCKHYDVKVINDKGVAVKVCKVRGNDIRVIVDLDAPNCTDYVYGW